MTGGDNSFSKTICSICYEDLKPIVEDLQSISICGHVFHELCLQQWFEYCSSSTKKYNCPVCKQICVGHNATRLYFQSVGDQSQSLCSQKLIDREEDAESLRIEVKRLLVKVSGLSSALEHQEKEHNQINEELCLCKEQMKREMALKNEALREKASIQQRLSSKSEELSKSNSECSRLEQRNLALAKELAVLKLVTDLDLEQDEMLKLASLGNEGSSQDVVDNLIRSLSCHKKSYKELMAKCNLLGRGEARLQKKLDKAKAKIDKLKKRVQELDALIEVKDNEVLRALKASKTDSEGGFLILDGNSDSSNAKISSKEQLMQRPVLPSNNLDVSAISPKHLPSSLKKNIPLDSPKAANYGREGCSSIAVPVGERNMAEDRYIYSSPDLKCQNREHIAQDSATPMPKPVSDIYVEAATVVGFSGSRTCSNIDDSATVASSLKPIFNIKTAAPSIILSEQGNICFSGGLLGPDGTRRHLGKWCKRSKMLGSMHAEGSTKNSGDLIAVGADGRGGKIKVLRSVNQSSLDNKENSVSIKRLKCEAKQNTLQSQGCLQIEHFFGKARH
ncbi:pentatricopeptide repeat-containing protein [Hibiscus syriacus]|uniref:Pentatricopeptide repeat-containing protein n=1 Tax=Hibiscus syriacus TaxID=106335 RepID=A0A6A2ZQW6_HIBSY|nr:E3 ubiquitin-protein ligase TRAIP-like [Hibiscus syriacus]KAE8693847.1 pentatricopeptide repeat-containing protein [Hibiscus syriacus]